jgi:hypothetical protein
MVEAAEIDRLMAEMQIGGGVLAIRGGASDQKTVRYANLAQAASITSQIILDPVFQWHPAYNQQKNIHASEVMAASTENNIA